MSRRPELDAAGHAAAALRDAQTWDRSRTCAISVDLKTGRRVFARRSRVWLSALIAFIAAILSLGPTQPLAARDPSTCRWIIIAILLTGLAACVRWWRQAVVVDGTRLVVRNFFVTWSAHASDLAWFAPAVSYGSFRSGLPIGFRDGRVREASGFGKGPLDRNAVGVAESQELNAWLADARAGRRNPPPHPRPRSTRDYVVLIVAFVVMAVAVALALPGVIDPRSLTH